MGQSGFFTLVNGTEYTWVLDPSVTVTYQVDTSEWPTRLEPGKLLLLFNRSRANTTEGRTAQMSLKYHSGWFVEEGDTQLRRLYHLEGTKACTFTVLVGNKPPRIQAVFNGFSTPGHMNNAWFDLGWVHDGTSRLILSGSEDNFSSNNGPIDWMHENLKKLGSRPLSQICMPGSHNAGMSGPGQNMNGLIAPMVMCQSSTVYGQLLDGSRYLDIRPIIGGGTFWTGHYSKGIKDMWVGDRGQSIPSIVDDINNFTSLYKELVIVNLSHAMNTDVGATNYRPFTQSEWNGVLAAFDNVKHRVVVSSAEEARKLTQQPLKYFIGKRAAVIIVVEADNGISLGEYEHRGFFHPTEVNVRNEYANTDDPTTMIKSQLGKLDALQIAANPDLFLLSWTLTPQAPDTSFGSNWLQTWINMARSFSIRTLAYTANKELFLECLPHCHGNNIPNILYVDYLEGRDYSALAMAVNDRCFLNIQPHL